MGFLKKLLALSLFFGFASLWNIYLAKTEEIPAYGDRYSEALVGGPQFINPILISSNDVDRDISELVYSGLMEYSPEGDIVPALAKSYKISNDGKEYTFYLRDDVSWHDGKKFTADDVVFTISSIINPDYSSPLRSSWQGIRIEKLDDHTIKFILNNTYAPFLEKATLGIIPKHIWEPTEPKNIILASANLNPIGTGPYKTKKMIKNKEGQITAFVLEANGSYYKKRPYIDEVEFDFYDDEEQAVNAYQKNDVLGVYSVSPKNKYLIFNNSTQIHNLNIPKYFAIFFNQNQSLILADDKVRQALAYATDKKAIDKEVFLGETKLIDSPILPSLSGYNDNVNKYPYDIEKAKGILAQAGWADKNGDGILEKSAGKGKEPVNLEITIATSDFADLAKTADMIKEEWAKAGIKVNVENYSIDDLKQTVIKPRKYDALIFGEVLSHYPDPFAFWHSSQKRDPGLNLALYSNKDVDKLLEDARQTIDEKQRNAKLQKFQEILADEIPAIFLYSPNYLYPVSKDVKGISV
ncbi:hypothetical protein HY249_00205, partial [Candidatus Azambacteria bacterium]|nr:hypothetical protein [Candidatus Azambacteria bacterium]